MKKSIITITSALFALSAMAQEDISNVSWDYTVSSNQSGVSGASYENVWIKSGTISGDAYGGTGITKIGTEDGKGPSIGKTILGIVSSGKKFRGAELGFNATEEGSTSVYIYGGTFTDKVSAVDNYNTHSIDYKGTLNKRTGNMYIYGGTYYSDITGLGMAQSGNYTANTNVQILGNITGLTSNLSGIGVYGGMSGASGGIGNLYGNTSVTVSGNGKTNYVVGGNRRPGNLTGTSTVNIINGGSVAGIIGGNYIADIEESSVDKNLTSVIDGNITVNIDGGNVVKSDSSVFSGILSGGVNNKVTGSTVTNIKAGTVTAGIVGGNAGWQTLSMDNTVINISGGTITAEGNSSYVGVSIANQIYAGALALGLNASYNVTTKSVTIKSYSNITIDNGTAINISGGAITGNIFGGGYAQGADATYYGKMTVNGGSQITVDAENDISIAGNIYGGGNQGSNGTSIVNGGTNVVFSNNDGKTLTFTGVVSGNGLNGAVVNGTKVFSFDNYNGAFGGTIENFDIVNIKTSNLTGNINLSSTASNVFVYGVSSIDSIINGMTSITIDKDAVFTIENSSLLDGVNLVNNGQLIIKNYDSEAGVEVKGELVVDESLSLDIGTETSAVVKSVENVTETFVEDFANSFVGESTSEFKAAAFDFDIVLEQGESVTLSFFVGDSELNAENFTIFHEQNGEWSQAEDVSNVKYEDGVLSFDVSHFSGYGYIATAVPEPAEWAMLLGSLALALAVYRRRK